MSKKYTVNQGFMSLLTYSLEDDHHLAQLHRCRHCRCAYAPTSNTASHDNHEKITSWVTFSFLYGYGVPLGVRAAGAPLLIHKFQSESIYIHQGTSNNLDAETRDSETEANEQLENEFRILLIKVKVIPLKLFHYQTFFETWCN